VNLASETAASPSTTIAVVTGLSGAGKSTALHSLEDLGYFCIDNLPTALAPQAAALCLHGGIERVAFGIDVRVRAFLGEVSEVLAALERTGQRFEVLFLDASDESLLRRYSETRRPHPLSAAGAGSWSQAGPVAVFDSIAIERERLAPLRARANLVVDTTRLSVHELRKVIRTHFSSASGEGPRMLTRIVSFGFKYGTPVDADLVFDVRFLDNPHFVDELRPLPGTDGRVSRFVLGLAETEPFLEKIASLLDFAIPRYEREGKSYLTVAVGCTGGRHRSVVLTESLSGMLETSGNPNAVIHRDLWRVGFDAGSLAVEAEAREAAQLAHGKGVG